MNSESEETPEHDWISAALPAEANAPLAVTETVRPETVPLSRLEALPTTWTGGRGRISTIVAATAGTAAARWRRRATLPDRHARRTAAARARAPVPRRAR